MVQYVKSIFRICVDIGPLSSALCEVVPGRSGPDSIILGGDAITYPALWDPVGVRVELPSKTRSGLGPA